MFSKVLLAVAGACEFVRNEVSISKFGLDNTWFLTVTFPKHTSQLRIHVLV